MTRVTAPIGKLARSLSSHPSVARPAYISTTSGPQHHAAAAGRTELGERDDNSSRRFTTAHRPTPSPVPSPGRVVPLMQTFSFRTTGPRAARLDTSTIDYAVMPSLAADAAADAAAARSQSLRVPLLPDNFFPARDSIAGHHPEVADGPLAAPQIVVVAAHPDVVAAASPLTEVEGMGVDGVELKFAHLLATAGGSGRTAAATAAANAAEDSESGGMIRDLWKGLVEDLTPPPAAAAASKTV